MTLVRDFTSPALTLGCNTVIIIRDHGTVTVNGVPEAKKITLKAKGSLLFFRDLSDALEMLSPNIVHLILTDRFVHQQIEFSTLSRQKLPKCS